MTLKEVVYFQKEKMMRVHPQRQTSAPEKWLEDEPFFFEMVPFLQDIRSFEGV